MNRRVLPGLLAWTVLSPLATACGPFFHDTVLDKPQAALDVPPVSYVGELSKIAGVSPVGSFRDTDESTFLAQIPAELKELKQLWTDLKVEPAEIERRLGHYKEVREALLKGLDATQANRFPTQAASPPTVPERPLDSEFPPEVADYVEGARLQALGQTEQARALWKAILDRPIGQRRLRCVWAAWMLAKTSPDEAECLTWYERVEKEAAAGGSDAIGLVASSMGWRAMFAPDPTEKLNLYFEGFRRGHAKNLFEVRRCSRDLLRSQDKDVLAKAAADPVARQLIHLHLQATLDHSREERFVDDSAPPPPSVPEPWLEAVKANAKRPLADGPRLAWALYAVGRFEEARHWLDLSDQSEPLPLWLQAKFDLRAGKLDAAQAHLDAAIRKGKSSGDWNPANPYMESYWYNNGDERQQANQGRLLADAGLVALGREDYLQALELLRTGGYDADAAYIAEHLLSTSSLLNHTKKVAPRASDRPVAEDRSCFEHYSFEEAPPEVDPATCLEPDRIGVYQWLRNPDNRLRYELARRLAREGQFDEAIPFMPPQVDKLFRHYVALDHARKSGRHKGTTLAAILWRQARIHRWWGAQLFSTDSFPDGGIYEWDHPAPNLNELRPLREGWTEVWSGGSRYKGTLEFVAAKTEKDKAVPLIRADELRRLAIPRLKYNHRYHYRAVAADLAWQAAKLLPDDDPQLALLYNTAGRWVETTAPATADRFYESLLKRCPSTEIAARTEACHWFVRDVESLKDLPGLPAGLIPKPFQTRWQPKRPSDSTDPQ